MSKLIYSVSSAQLEQSLQGVYQTGEVNPNLEGYRSIAFTGDGYLYTHGQKFRIYKVTNTTSEGLHLGWNSSDGWLNLLDGSTVLGQIDALKELEGDGVVIATRGTGSNYNKYTLTHAQPSNLTTDITYGGIANESSINIPTITIDSYGHITVISNLSLDATKIKASALTNSNSENYYIVGVSGGTIQAPKYSSNTYIDKEGQIYEGSVALSNKYAAKQTANANTTGTVKLSDAIDGGAVTVDNTTTYLDVTKGTAATPYAIKLALDSAKTYAEGLFASNDALVFIGTIGIDGAFRSHNNVILPDITDNVTTIGSINYKAGYTMKFVQAGNVTIGTGDNATTFAVEIGDILVCVSNKVSNTTKGSDFTVVQNNIDGAVTASNNLSGIVIGTDSKVVSSFGYPTSGTKLLKATESGLAWADYSSVWRTFYNGNTSGGTINNKDIILKTATGNATDNPIAITFGTEDGNATITYTINPKAIASSAISSLTLVKGNTSFVYDPTSSDQSLTIGNGLSLISTTSGQDTTYTLDHPTYTGISTPTLGAITVDSYGHVTAITSVNSLKNPNALYIATTNGATTVLQESGTYDGSEVIGYNFKAGTDVSITATAKSASDGITYSGTRKAKGIELEFGITHKYRPINIQKKSGGSYASASEVYTNAQSDTLTLKEGAYTTITNNSGVITIEAVRRTISLYQVSQQKTAISQGNLDSSSVLAFNSDLVVDNDALGICWTEIDASGVITYTN